MFITLCVIAYNEEKTIRAILDDIVNQDFNHNDIEVLLVNSASTDNTRQIMIDFAKENASNKNMQFRSVHVLENPKKTLPCGWNLAIKVYKGEAILKVDAHAQIPSDFVSKNVSVLESGEDISGGQRPSIIDEPTKWKETLLLAESSMFGSSIAPYRNNPGRSYVKSLFHAAYRREVFEKVGFFNEELVRTEDNEIHYRMRKAGYKLCFDPDIRSYQYTRSSLKAMLKQKYANGYWIGKTSKVCPKCLSIYHFVPFAFVVAIIISTLICAGFYGVFTAGIFLTIYNIIVILTKFMWITYTLLAVIMAVLSVIQAKDKANITCILLPVLFFLLHISYGIGTLMGLIKMPFWLKGIKDGRNKKR